MKNRKNNWSSFSKSQVEVIRAGLHQLAGKDGLRKIDIDSRYRIGLCETMIGEIWHELHARSMKRG